MLEGVPEENKEENHQLGKNHSVGRPQTTITPEREGHETTK